METTIHTASVLTAVNEEDKIILNKTFNKGTKSFKKYSMTTHNLNLDK